ncbi:MAG: hypothetical protein FWE37_03050 [Spirochaetaceae bacterium]|nr:hypothetical protein [Spirochaetaceae bacterium]
MNKIEEFVITERLLDVWGHFLEFVPTQINSVTVQATTNEEVLLNAIENEEEEPNEHEYKLYRLNPGQGLIQVAAANVGRIMKVDYDHNEAKIITAKKLNNIAILPSTNRIAITTKNIQYDLAKRRYLLNHLGAKNGRPFSYNFLKNFVVVNEQGIVLPNNKRREWINARLSLRRKRWLPKLLVEQHIAYAYHQETTGYTGFFCFEKPAKQLIDYITLRIPGLPIQFKEVHSLDYLVLDTFMVIYEGPLEGFVVIHESYVNKGLEVEYFGLGSVLNVSDCNKKVTERWEDLPNYASFSLEGVQSFTFNEAWVACMVRVTVYDGRTYTAYPSQPNRNLGIAAEQIAARGGTGGWGSNAAGGGMGGAGGAGNAAGTSGNWGNGGSRSGGSGGSGGGAGEHGNDGIGLNLNANELALINRQYRSPLILNINNNSAITLRGEARRHGVAGGNGASGANGLNGAGASGIGSGGDGGGGGIGGGPGANGRDGERGSTGSFSRAGAGGGGGGAGGGRGTTGMPSAFNYELTNSNFAMQTGAVSGFGGIGGGGGGAGGGGGGGQTGSGGSGPRGGNGGAGGRGGKGGKGGNMTASFMPASWSAVGVAGRADSACYVEIRWV